MARITGGGADHVSRALEEFSRAISKDVALKVGFLRGATYPNGTPVAMVAAVNEFGRPSIGQPPRPAFRNMIAAKSGEWPLAIADLLRDNNYDVEKVLHLAGEAITGQLRQSIRDLWTPPLKPATIARKGFAKPLIESGHELNSVDFEVTFD